MKVLAIMGSPRKGESYKVTKSLEEKLTVDGDVEFEYLFLREAGLGECVGCHACIQRGEEFCPVKEARDRIIAKIEAADGVIFVTPVYSQQVSALMKRFVDQLSYLYHRPRFFGKPAMYVASGGAQFSSTLNYLAEVTKAWGMTPAAKLGVPHFEALKPPYQAKVRKSIDEAAAKFSAALRRKAPRVPGVGDLLWFKMWKLTAAATKDDSGADYAYWKDKWWMQSDYYYPVSIAGWKRLLAGLGGRAMLAFMRRMYEGY